MCVVYMCAYVCVCERERAIHLHFLLIPPSVLTQSWPRAKSHGCSDRAGEMVAQLLCSKSCMEISQPSPAIIYTVSRLRIDIMSTSQLRGLRLAQGH